MKGELGDDGPQGRRGLDGIKGKSIVALILLNSAKLFPLPL